jgi:hypothetical protein
MILLATPVAIVVMPVMMPFTPVRPAATEQQHARQYDDPSSSAFHVMVSSPEKPGLAKF